MRMHARHHQISQITSFALSFRHFTIEVLKIKDVNYLPLYSII